MKKYHYVYITTNLINGKQYVGDRSCNCLPEEDSYLGSGRPLFENAKKKYGKENFSKEILEILDSREKTHKAEEKYIQIYKTHISQGGYNISWKGGYGKNNDTLSKETKQKLSQIKKGIKFSDIHKENLKKTHTGLKQSKETVNRRISKTTGLKRSEEFKEKLRKPKSKQTRERIKATLTGQKHAEERKQNQKIAQLKRWSDPEERKKQSDRLKGRKLDKETKEKISKALSGKTQKKIKCPHCGKIGPKPQMHQWHLNNCKWNT